VTPRLPDTLSGHRTRRRVATGIATAALALAGLWSALPAGGSGPPFLSGLTHTSVISSTVPKDGDVNPYGLAVVPSTVGHLVQGDVLVANFNNANNKQGTGKTIVEVSPSAGTETTFAHIAQMPPGVGLTTALAVLPNGFVAVGSLPTSNGRPHTAAAGGIFVLNNLGQVVETITAPDIDGPWDLTATPTRGNQADLFVTNVLNGTVAAKGAVVNGGTVVRLTLDLNGPIPTLLGNTIIGSGYAERTDPAALVVGPTGVGLAPDGTLYVADTVNSQIRAIPRALSRGDSAGLGALVTAAPGSLNGPLGLTVAPNADILTVNGGDGNVVETTPSGTQVATFALDASGNPPGAGALFGLAVTPSGNGLYYVDDATNTLDLLGP